MSTPAGMGIKAILAEYGKFTGSNFVDIQQALMNSIPLPTVEYEGPARVNYGEVIEFTIKGLPLPKMDLYEYALKEQEAGKLPVLASFQGAWGPITVRAKYDPTTGRARVSVPQTATDGQVTFQFPIPAYIGPRELIEQINADDEILQKGICAWFPKRVTAPEDCKYKIPESIERTWWITTLCAYRFKFLCNFTLDCPIVCPEGAIEKDENLECFINVEKCAGCFDCFAPGDFSCRPEDSNYPNYSTKCKQGRLKRVLWINPDVCCAGCPSYESVQLEGLNLQQLCPENAIYIEYRANGTDRFAVDELRCKGCWACINGLNCYTNSIRRVAYIEPRA